MAFAPPARHLLRAKDLAEARYFERLSVDDLAGAAGLSRAHFSREFRRAFGETPHSYLLTRRLERSPEGVHDRPHVARGETRVQRQAKAPFEGGKRTRKPARVARVPRLGAERAGRLCGVAADVLNQKGGILGKKIELVIEDNRSEPQEAVVGYRKMISSDNVKMFASGCVSAGKAQR